MPREHKGIEELVNAVLNVNHENLKLLIVGGDVHHKYYQKLLSIGGDSIKAVGPRPHSEMPSFLAASDMVVLPQRETLFANAQVPAKVFEAMAMGKSVISTNVSDLGEILDGCGIIIEPNLDTTNLENQIRILVNDPTVSKSLGLRAREKCISQYSWDSMESKLYTIFDQHLNK
jgi:glycosyltransferase involved in cell wall biosynthesis